VRVPADVDMADRILAGLTARQLAIIGAHVLALWALWFVVGQHIPVFAFGALAVPIAAVGLVWATSKVEGTTLERLALAAIRHVARPRRRVLAPEGLPELPKWWGASTDAVAPLDLPVQTVAPDGYLELGDEGLAVVCRASSLNFTLRSEAEQRALTDGFGRLLNALDAPAQFLVRSERADLRAVIEGIEERATALPHPALEAAALEHAAFLGSLASQRNALSRRVFISFRERGARDEASTRLAHRAEEAETLLRGLGIKLKHLAPLEVAELLSRASDPESAPPPLGGALPDEVVEGRW